MHGYDSIECHDMKKAVAVGILIVVSSVIRLFYARVFPSVNMSPDSYNYYELAKQQAVQPSLSSFISPFRTPVYPTFLRFILSISVHNLPDVSTPDFFRGMRQVSGTQAVLSVFAVVVLYLTLLRIGVSSFFSFVLALIHGINMMFIPWQRMVLTESLAISWVIFYCYILVLLLQSPRVYVFVFCLALSVLGVFLRPALVLLPSIGFLLVALYHKKRLVTILAGFFLLYYLISVAAYVKLNGEINGYAGLSVNGDIGLLARILEHNFSLEPAKNISYFYDLATRFKSLNIPFDPIMLYRYVDNGEVYTPKRMRELSRFTKTIVFHNVPQFTLFSLQKIPKALTTTSVWIQIPNDQKNISVSFLSVLQRLSLSLQYLWPIFFVGSFIALYRLLHSPGLLDGSIAAFCAVAWVQIFVSVLVSPDEHGRLTAIIMPQVILVSLLTLKRVFSKGNL